MKVRVIDKYVHPLTKSPLFIDACGNLSLADSDRNVVYENDNGTYDFVSGKGCESIEREHYGNVYKKKSAASLSVETCRNMWNNEPGFEQLLASMGDITGKKVLLLGNGVSVKEFYFLCLGARCVYTDLSIEAVKYMKGTFEQSEFGWSDVANIEFNAIDAYHLPFSDNSFDIIYGCAFVHHLGDLDTFFSEIHRCLKPGGICRFLDHGYSPLWQFLKRTVLRPLQLYTHRRHGISPADVAATHRGGYKRMEIEHIKNAHAFRDMMYVRGAFLEQILQRGTLKLGCRFLRKLKPLMRGLDNLSEWAFDFIEKNGMVLVWGFTK
jgi:SAM-dependent methyltransferase